MLSILLYIKAEGNTNKFLDIEDECIAAGSRIQWHSYTDKLLEVLILRLVCGETMKMCSEKPQKPHMFWPTVSRHQYPNVYRKINLIKIIWTKQILSDLFLSFRKNDLPGKPTRIIDHTKYFYNSPPLKDTCPSLREQPDQWNSCSVCSYCRHWDFYIPPQLSSNMTINELLTSAKFLVCSMGQLAIFASSVTHNRRHGRFFTGKLCGHFSFFRMYFVRNVHLKMFTTFHSLFVLDGFLTVCSRFMENSQTRTTKNRMYPMFHLKSLRGRIVSYFLMETKKSCCFEIAIAPKGGLNAEVFDGPGKLSKTLLPLHNIYISSSFTCLVMLKIYAHNGMLATAESNLQMLFINFSSFVNILHDRHLLEPAYIVNMQLPPKNTIQTPYLLLVETETAFKINVTITNMSYHRAYLDTVACRYGGLVGADNFHKDSQESGPFCMDHDFSASFSRSMYSQNASFLLVLYWFSHYSSITTILSISKTHCSSVRFDSCFNGGLGPVPHSAIVHLSKYLPMRRQPGGIRERVYEYHIEENDCVVIQFSFSQNFQVGNVTCDHYMSRQQRRHILRKFETKSTFQRSLMYIIKGSLEASSCSTICGNKDQHNMGFEQFIVEDIKVAKEFYFLSGNRMSCKHHLDFMGKQSNSFVGSNDISIHVQSMMHKVQFYMYAKVQSNSFIFSIFHYPHTKSWTEIIIWNEPSRAEAFGFSSYKQELRFASDLLVSNFDPKIKTRFKNTQVALLKMQTNSKYYFVPNLKIHTQFDSSLPSFYPIFSHITHIKLKTSSLSLFMSFHDNFPSTKFSWNASKWKPNASIHFQLMLISNNYQNYIEWVDKGSHQERVKTTGSKKVTLSGRTGRHMLYLHTSVQLKCRKYGTAADVINPKLYHWQESLGLCHKFHSFLPYFTQSDELQEFITFMKVVDADEDHGTFIGLQTRKVTQI